MTNPVLVEVTRGALVESRHRGALVVTDADGVQLVSLGDTEAPVFPRSAVKLIQALPLVESGAADAFAYGDEELALACASHGGEDRHVAVAATALAKCGHDAADLECGSHAPLDAAAARALAARGEAPGPLHNNCSGKHAGFICFATHLGADVRGYVMPDHPVQREVTSALEDLTGMRLGPDVRGIDGCSIPTYAVPLHRLALAFARLASGIGLSPVRMRAARRLFDACTREPWLVAGTGRFCTDVMTAYKDRIYVKTGAEGVYCAAIPELGLGVALKCDDGATRASEAIMAAVIAALLPLPESADFNRRLAPPVETRTGKKVGEIKPVGAIAERIRQAICARTPH